MRSLAQIAAGKRKDAPSGYDAFISYSHSADGMLAPSLQRGLRGFAKPWYRLRALRVFRDQTSLSASPALWSGIERALAASRFFVLLASPEAAASPWVDREVRYWREYKEMAHFLIALTDGEIAWDPAAGDFAWEQATAVPRSLEGTLAQEPFWVDLRFARAEADVSLRQPKFRDAIADLAAPIHGQEKDALIGEDIGQHRRTVRLARAAVATLGGLLIAASVAAFVAVQQRNTARTQRNNATSLALASVAGGQLASHSDVALLLSLGAYRASATAQAESSMISALDSVRHSGAEAILRGHQGSVSDLAFSPDGHTLASAGDNGTVLLWDLRQPRKFAQRLIGQAGSGVAFSSDGHTLASAGDEGRVFLWDVRKPQAPARTLAGTAGGAVWDMAFAPDGHSLASAGQDGALYGTVLLWDTRSRKRRGQPLTSNQDTIWDVAFSPDSHTVASTGGDGKVVLWDTRARGKPIQLLTGHDGTVQGVAFGRDGHTIAAGQDGKVRLWDTRAPRKIASSLRGAQGVVYDVAFSPDGHTLASAGDDGTVRLFNTKVPQWRGQVLKGHQGPVRSVAFSRDGHTLASAGDDGTIRLWDLRALNTSGRLLSGDVNPFSLLAPPSLAFGSDGQMLASGGPSGLLLWDFRQPREAARVLTKRSVSDIAFSSDGHTLASSGFREGAIQLWDIRTSRKPTLLPASQSAYGFAFSPDGRMLASGGDDPEVRLWDVTTPEKPSQVLTGSAHGVARVAFSRDGHTLASIGDDGNYGAAVLLWDLRRPRGPRRSLTAYGGLSDYLSIAFSPDGHTLASAGYKDVASEAGKVLFWDTRTPGQPPDVLAGRYGIIHDLAFSPNGHTLASVGDHGDILLSDVRTPREPGHPVSGGHLALSAVAFSPDGRTLATVAENGTVRLWEGILWRDRDDLTAQVCGLVTGDLTEAEWKKLVPDLPYRRACPSD